MVHTIEGKEEDDVTYVEREVHLEGKGRIYHNGIQSVSFQSIATDARKRSSQMTAHNRLTGSQPIVEIMSRITLLKKTNVEREVLTLTWRQVKEADDTNGPRLRNHPGNPNSLVYWLHSWREEKNLYQQRQPHLAVSIAPSE